MTEHHLEFLSSNGAVQTRLNLHLSKCHIVGNHMSLLSLLLLPLSVVVLVLLGSA